MEPGAEHQPPIAQRPIRLALIEIFERDGRLGRSASVRHWPLTLGRALDNDVVLDDPHMAAHHATLQPDSRGQLQLQVGDSINGITVGKAHHAAGARVDLPPEGATLQLGGVKLRLRLPQEQLAPERALPALARARLVGPLGAGLALLLLALLDHWMSLDPGADTAAWLPLVVGLPVVLAGWCGVWALASKLFQHRFDFLGHLQIALPWLLAIEVLDLVLTPLAASLGWPLLWRVVAPLQLLLALLMLRLHLLQVLPQSGRVVTTFLVAAALAGTAISLAITQRATDRFSRPAYMSTLPLPALNLTRPVTAPQLVQELAPLAEQLAVRVKQARDDEPPEGEHSSD